MSHGRRSTPQLHPASPPALGVHPANIRQRLLANVWCGHCRHEVTITDFSGAIKGGDLLLVGKCAECHGEVARVIEGS